MVLPGVNSFIYFPSTNFQITSVRLELQIHHSTWTYPWGLQHIWNVAGFSYVILGIAFLLPFQHNLMCESRWYFCLLLVWISWQQKCALSKVTSATLCFHCCLLLPSLLVTNLGKGAFEDVYIGDYRMLKDVSELPSNMGNSVPLWPKLKRKNT